MKAINEVMFPTKQAHELKGRDAILHSYMIQLFYHLPFGYINTYLESQGVNAVFGTLRSEKLIRGIMVAIENKPAQKTIVK